MTTIRQANLIKSNVGWIGDMPSHWQIVPAKALFRLRSEKAGVSDVHLTPSQKYGVLPQVEYMEITGNRVVLNLIDSGQMKHVEPGDFVSHLRSFQGGLELAKMSGKVSGAYTVVIPREDQYPDYWRYALKSDTYVQALQTTTDQLRDGQSIRMKEFSSIKLPLVPLDEQKAIADFLDRELAQIDALISKQDELVSTLVQRRTAVVRERVLRGIDPLVKMRSVNAEWINSTPSNWEVCALKRVAKLKTGGTPSGAEFESTQGEHPWLRPDDLNPDGKPSQATRFISESDTLGLPKVRKGATLICGVGATVGKSGQVQIPSYYNQQITSVDSCMSDRYMFYIALSAREELMRLSVGNTLPILNNERLGALVIPIPPIDEQVAIAEDLDKSLLVIDLIVETALRAREIEIERRQALISAAVTGKIDVRKVA